jgi:Spy/CpxP family protein refolding chaperone
MRKMLIALAVAGVLTGPLGIGPVAWAGRSVPQGPRRAPTARLHRSPAQREVERMSEALNLTAAQKARILPILEQRNQQLKALRAQSSLPQGYARTKATEIRKSARRRIDLILTPEQKEKQSLTRRAKK